MDVIMLTGLPGTGKSTTAAKLQARLGYDLHSLLEARRELGLIRYSYDSGFAAMQILGERTGKSLANGKSVIVDSSFTTRRVRQDFYGIASDYGASTLLLECICSEEEAKRRIRSRPANQGIVAEPRRPEAYDRIAQRRESVTLAEFSPFPNASYVVLNTQDGSLDERLVLPGARQLVAIVKETAASSAR